MALILAAGLVAGCTSSGAPGTRSTTEAPTSAASLPAVSATQAETLAVTVPFDADHGALQLAEGPSPDGLTAHQAETTFTSLVATTVYGTESLPTAGETPRHQLLAGRVTLRSGFGVAILDGVPAWVVIYSAVPPSCGIANLGKPATSGPTTSPPWASDLYALIITGTAPADTIAYYGAGTGVCSEVRPAPIARAAPQTLE